MKNLELLSTVIWPIDNRSVIICRFPMSFIYCAGGFNQPIMCGGEPRAMLQKVRGSADPPIYTIQICIPKHGMHVYIYIYITSEPNSSFPFLSHSLFCSIEFDIFVHKRGRVGWPV